MGLLKDALGPAFGASKANNGMKGPMSKLMRGSPGNNTSSAPGLQYLDPYSDSRYTYPQQTPRRAGNQQGSRSPACPSQDAYESRAYSDNPPPYGEHMGGYELARFGTQDDAYDHSRADRNARSGAGHSPQPSISASRTRSTRFRPLALPQVAFGEGKPFLRGYSDELMRCNISKADFIRIVDSLNEAIIPNPEAQIFQKAANIAGYFLPGVDGIALAAVQVGVGIGAAIGHGGMLGKRLSQANLHIFIPAGLEICIGKGQNVDQEAGYSPSSQAFRGDADPEVRLEQYGDSLMPLSAIYPDQKKIGRQDPIAMLSRGISIRDNQRKMSRASREKERGRRSKKGDALEGGLQWLIVREASVDSTAQWQKMLQKSEAALAQEQAQSSGSGNRR